MAVLALAGVPVALAAKPPKKGGAGVTLDAKPVTIVFSKPTTLSGRLKAPGSTNGVRVVLEQDATRPYGDAYRRTNLATTTSKGGDFRFTVAPRANTQYRAIAQTSPPATSKPRLVLVRMLTGLRLSSRTPRSGAFVRFSGSVYPAHDGRAVRVQRESAGRWVTVAGARLRDAGTARSSYAKRVRIRRDGQYRVKVVGDADHVNGISRTIAIDAR